MQHGRSTKIQEGYKVLRKQSNGTRTSCIFGRTDHWNGAKSVEYPVDERVHRPKYWGPLAVFCSERPAEAFLQYTIQRCAAHRIVRCRYKPSKARALWYHLDKRELYVLSLAWLVRGGRGHPPGLGSRLGSLPSGTRFAEWVECLE